MTIELRPEDTRVINEAIQAGLIHDADQVVGVGVETLRSRLEECLVSEKPTRQEAVRAMLAFGDKYQLSLGERMTRDLLHERHRY